MTRKQHVIIYVGCIVAGPLALLIGLTLMAATCEPTESTPCAPDTLYVYEYRYKSINFDSALQAYSPHTNLQTDTSNYRDEIRRLKAENLNLAKHNANLSLLISQQRARILADEIKLRHCVWIQDTVNIKK